MSVQSPRPSGGPRLIADGVSIPLPGHRAGQPVDETWPLLTPTRRLRSGTLEPRGAARYQGRFAVTIGQNATKEQAAAVLAALDADTLLFVPATVQAGDPPDAVEEQHLVAVEGDRPSGRDFVVRRVVATFELRTVWLYDAPRGTAVELVTGDSAGGASGGSGAAGSFGEPDAFGDGDGSVPGARSLTFVGANGLLVSSPNTQTLEANRTWTVSAAQNIGTTGAPTFAGLVLTGPLDAQGATFGGQLVGQGATFAGAVTAPVATLGAGTVQGALRLGTGTAGGRLVPQAAGVLAIVAPDGSNTGSAYVDTLKVRRLVLTEVLDMEVTNTLAVEDQWVKVARGQAGVPSLNGGLQLERGAQPDANVVEWDEPTQRSGMRVGAGPFMPFARTSEEEQWLQAQFFLQGAEFYGSGLYVEGNNFVVDAAQNYIAGALQLGTPATAANHAVRADRVLTFASSLGFTWSAARDLTADRTWTLTPPQNLQTSGTPQFLRLGIGAAAGSVSDLYVTSARTTGQDPHVLFNVAKDSTHGAAVAYRRATTAQQVLFGFETGSSSSPDGSVGTLAGSVGTVWMLASTGGAGALGVGPLGVVVGTAGPAGLAALCALDVRGTARWTGSAIAARTTAGRVLESDGATGGMQGVGLVLERMTDAAYAVSLDDMLLRRILRVREIRAMQMSYLGGSTIVAPTFTVRTSVHNVAGVGAGQPGASYQLASEEAVAGVTTGAVLEASRLTYDGAGAPNGLAYSRVRVSGTSGPQNVTVYLVSGDAPVAGMEYGRVHHLTDPDQQGYLYLTGSDSGAPYMSVLTTAGTDAATFTRSEVGRVGRLAGLPGFTAADFGVTGGNTAAGWASLSNRGVEFWQGSLAVGYVKATGLRLGDAESFLAFNAATSTFQLQLDGRPVVTGSSSGGFTSLVLAGDNVTLAASAIDLVGVTRFTEAAGGVSLGFLRSRAPSAAAGVLAYFPLRSHLRDVVATRQATAVNTTQLPRSGRYQAGATAVESATQNVILYPPNSGQLPYSDSGAGKVLLSETYRGQRILSCPNAGNLYWYAGLTDNTVTSTGWTVSVLVRRQDRGAVTGGNMYLRTNGGAGNFDGYTTDVEALGDGWYRLSKSVQLGSAQTHFLSGFAGNTNGTGDAYDVTGWQIEPNAWPTAYTPTSRGAGSLAFGVTPPQAAGTVTAWVRVPERTGTVVQDTPVLSFGGAAENALWVSDAGKALGWFSNSGALWATDTGYSDGAHGYTTGDWVHVTLAWGSGNRTLTVYCPRTGWSSTRSQANVPSSTGQLRAGHPSYPGLNTSGALEQVTVLGFPLAVADATVLATSSAPLAETSGETFISGARIDVGGTILIDGATGTISAGLVSASSVLAGSAFVGSVAGGLWLNPEGVDVGSIAFAIGVGSFDTAAFRVDYQGGLVATNATLSGTLNLPHWTFGPGLFGGPWDGMRRDDSNYWVATNTATSFRMGGTAGVNYASADGYVGLGSSVRVTGNVSVTGSLKTGTATVDAGTGAYIGADGWRLGTGFGDFIQAAGGFLALSSRNVDIYSADEFGERYMTLDTTHLAFGPAAYEGPGGADGIWIGLEGGKATSLPGMYVGAFSYSGGVTYLSGWTAEAGRLASTDGGYTTSLDAGLRELRVTRDVDGFVPLRLGDFDVAEVPYTPAALSVTTGSWSFVSGSGSVSGQTVTAAPGSVARRDFTLTGYAGKQVALDFTLAGASGTPTVWGSVEVAVTNQAGAFVASYYERDPQAAGGISWTLNGRVPTGTTALRVTLTHYNGAAGIPGKPQSTVSYSLTVTAARGYDRTASQYGRNGLSIFNSPTNRFLITTGGIEIAAARFETDGLVIRAGVNPPTVPSGVQAVVLAVDSAGNLFWRDMNSGLHYVSSQSTPPVVPGNL